MNMQLALFDPLPNLFQPLRKMFHKNWIRINFWQLRKKRLIVRDELEKEISRFYALVQSEQPVDRLLPEDAHGSKHHFVKLDKTIPIFVTAEEERVGILKSDKKYS